VPQGEPELFMIEIRARDFGALCDFYEEVLGLTVAMRDLKAGFAMFGKKPPYLAVVRKAVRGTPKRSRALPDFKVDDLDAALSRLKAAQVAVLAEPSASPEGYRIARIADPEGNEIHLFEWVDGAGPGA
jgi:glyoxylase I family protein